LSLKIPALNAIGGMVYFLFIEKDEDIFYFGLLEVSIMVIKWLSSFPFICYAGLIFSFSSSTSCILWFSLFYTDYFISSPHSPFSSSSVIVRDITAAAPSISIPFEFVYYI
jgi:hypothetical protein